MSRLLMPLWAPEIERCYMPFAKGLVGKGCRFVRSGSWTVEVAESVK